MRTRTTSLSSDGQATAAERKTTANRERRRAQPFVGSSPRRRYLEELEQKLREAVETIGAMRSGARGGALVDVPDGTEMHAPESPDEPFRVFVEGMQEGALTLAAEGTILYANAFFATLLGRPVEQIIGAPLAAFAVPEFQFTCTELVVQGTVQPVKGGLRLQTPSRAVPVQLTLTPLPGAGAARCSCVVFDLTEREQAEQANATREAAEQANQAKDRFLAVLSHELRSPLSTILGWSQILIARNDLSESNRKALSAIERNAHVQADLIDELLDVSRVVTGKLHLDLDVVDFSAIVRSAVASVRSEVDTRIDIQCDLPASEVFVTGDATRLSQIVTNLVDNAVRFTDAGGSVRVSVREHGDNADLSVSDGGAGILPEQIPYVFDLFRRGQSTGRRGKVGLGLGMAIAKQLVEAHGGEIEVRNAGVGRGTTFTVRLPCAASHSGSNPGFAFRRELSQLRVLLVDDEPDILEVLRHLLETEGASIQTAQTAAGALKLLDESDFDILVSDIGLPEQDGLALIREVRARGYSSSELPAIALTGYAGPDYARLASDAGFQLHLGKPVEARDLVSTIAQIVKRPTPN